MLEHVWPPGAIGPLTTPHRIVMGSMHLGLESLAATVARRSPRSMPSALRRARG